MARESIKTLAIKVLQRSKNGVRGEYQRESSGNFRGKNEYKSFLDIHEEIKRLKETEREDFEERAAIMEFDCNKPRGEAERMALERIIQKRKPWLN